MNQLTIIGNLTADPEMRTTRNGKSVCTFTVAVNRKQETDFFRVTAWDKLGELCHKWMGKGRKVSVIGPVSVSAYNGNDGTAHGQLNVTAQEVEFLSPKTEQEQKSYELPSDAVEVKEDELPF